MSDDDAREERERKLVFLRIKELAENPVLGDFDVGHLRAIHAYLFQDLPHHGPGVLRGDTPDGWIKHRALEGRATTYAVHYAHTDIERRLDDALRSFGGTESLKGLAIDVVSHRMATLYGDLDHAHGFYEGNSRTLREFMRGLAAAAGYALDWIGTGVGARERNDLYRARDIAVLERAFPGLTPARAARTNDRLEYEASFVLAGLRRAMRGKSLATILRAGLTPQTP